MKCNGKAIFFIFTMYLGTYLRTYWQPVLESLVFIIIFEWRNLMPRLVFIPERCNDNVNTSIWLNKKPNPKKKFKIRLTVKTNYIFFIHQFYGNFPLYMLCKIFDVLKLLKYQFQF